MEWYCGREIEDLVVPDHEQMSDWAPSPEAWYPWDKIVGSPRKLATVGIQEPMFSVKASSGNMEQLYASKGARPYFHRQSDSPFEYSYDHLDDFTRIDEADDIFFHSILDEDSSKKDDSSANFMQTSMNEDVTPVVHVSRDVRKNDLKLMNLKRQSVSASVAYDTSFSLEQALEFPESYKHSDVYQHVINDEMSMEECVLELQRFTDQLAEKTRICFRDAFYRLAENSRPENSCNQNGKEAHENCTPITRIQPAWLGEPKVKESDTNAIDQQSLLYFSIKMNIR